MTVAGYFDQHMRQNLFTAWCNHMQQAHIQFKPDIARIEVSFRYACLTFSCLVRAALLLHFVVSL